MIFQTKVYILVNSRPVYECLMDHIKTGDDDIITVHGKSYHCISSSSMMTVDGEVVYMNCTPVEMPSDDELERLRKENEELKEFIRANINNANAFLDSLE